MVQNVNVFQKAKALGFDGVQVAFDIKNKNQSLINEKVQENYKKYSVQYNIPICSCAAVNFMQNPLVISEDPVSIFLDYTKAMKNLGIKKILLPFFGAGDINANITLITSIKKSIRSMPSKDETLTKTIEILKIFADIAEGAQITVGLETKMSAETLKVILDKIGSQSIKVYYDAGNAHLMGYNILDEVKLLGINNICQIHLKEKYTTIGAGKIDYRKFLELLIAEGYKDWLIIESSKNRFLGLEASMKKNVSYLKDLMQQG